MKVIEKISEEYIYLDDYLNLFYLDSQGIFSVLESNKSYNNYLIYIQAENEFGIAGGADKFLIDISYKVIPQFKSDIGTIFVSLSE